MKLMPKSLSGRLLMGGTAMIAVAMIAAGLIIGSILERFIVGQIDQRLDSAINDVASQLIVNDSGSLSLGARGESPDFLRQKSGWYWQASSEQTSLHSPNLQTKLQVETPRFDWRNLLSGGASPTRAVDAEGTNLHGRVKFVTVGSQSVTIVATAPQMAITRPLLEGLISILLCLTVLSALLLLGLWALVKIGLRPLNQLKVNVEKVADGLSTSVETDLPSELRPLAAQLNNLIRVNAERLLTTRLQAANLAHSLKTPLASLSLALADVKAKPHLLQLVSRMQERIAYHLGRTRIAVMPGKKESRIYVEPKLRDILDALKKIHADKHINLTLTCTPEASVAWDAGDFDEIAGNLLENAFKWTKSEVHVAVAGNPGFRMSITDNGPGLSQTEISEALQPGKRLDERIPGDGFGLSIVSELIDLYGGSLKLMPSAQGSGLVVAVEMPEY